MKNESKYRSILRFASRAAAKDVPANEIYVAAKKQFGAHIAPSRLREILRTVGIFL